MTVGSAEPSAGRRQAMTFWRSRWGLLLAAATLVGIAAGLWWSSSREPAFSRQRFERVEVGMSREQVIATVGGPPGRYSDATGPPFGVHYTDYEDWWSDEGLLMVQFDEHDKATDVVLFDVMRRPRPTLIERLRQMLGF
jgi:hypothetical protein